MCVLAFTSILQSLRMLIYIYNRTEMRQPQRKDLRASIKPHLSSRFLAGAFPYPTHVSHAPHRPPIHRRHFFPSESPRHLGGRRPSTTYLQPTNVNPPTSTHPPLASPDQYRQSRTSPAGHLDISEPCVPRAQCQIKLLYWHLSSKKTSGKEQG